MFELLLENESGNLANINDEKKYVVLGVSGLNPPSATLFTSKSPNRKGVKYNGSTLGERNIVLTIKILGEIEKNRNDLYEWIDTEQYVKIRYKNGVKSVYCEGHIQDCEIDLFTNNEVIGLSIVCENPYWKDLAEVSTEISTLLKQFVFPFAIDKNGIPFSTIRESNHTNIFNVGAETGIKITIKCKDEVENLIIYDANDYSKQFRLNTTLGVNWIVEIDTEASPKKVVAYKPDGTTENLLKYTVNPTWFTLKKGNNLFGYSAVRGQTDAEISIGYRNKHLGV